MSSDDPPLSSATPQPQSDSPPAPTPTTTPDVPEASPVSVTPRDELDHIHPIPRVTIHAFCETEDVASVLNDSSQDRRMMKAHVTVQQGGLTSAIEYYGSVTTPNLVIIESRLTGTDLLDQLVSLAQVCNDGTNVLIIGHTNDVHLYRELISRGVSEYLVAPIKLVDFLQAMNMMFVSDDSAPLGRSIAFIGSRGGVGSSTIAHNVAFTITSKCESDVVLLDMDLPFGTANINFDQDPSQGISEAIASFDRIDDTYLDRLLVKCSDRLSLLAAPSNLLRECDFRPDEFQQVIEVALQGTPNVILDIPTVWTGWSRSTLLMADSIVIVASRDLACLRNTKNLVDYLNEHRPNDSPPLLVINMDGTPKRPELPLDDFLKPLGLSPTITLPFDAGIFGQAMNNGQMVSEVSSNSSISASFDLLSNILLGRDSSSPVEKKGLMDKFLKRS